LKLTKNHPVDSQSDCLLIVAVFLFVFSLCLRDDHGNGIHSNWESHGNPMGMGIDDRIVNGNGKEWESACMGMGMTLIPISYITLHRNFLT